MFFFVRHGFMRKAQLASFRNVNGRTSIHFVQESVKFHFQDVGRQCIILAGILKKISELARFCQKCQMPEDKQLLK